MSDDLVTARDIVEIRSAQLLAEAEARQTDWQAEATTELNRITGNQSNKKRDTIIALVDARLAGRPEESVWSLPQTCARSTYHDKWKQDPTFADVLDNVSTLARTWKDGEAMRALAEAARRLALASPMAVTTLISKLSSHDENIQVRSALGVLDRAGMETATKASSEVNSNMSLSVEEWREQAEESRAQAAAALEDFEED